MSRIRDIAPSRPQLADRITRRALLIGGGAAAGLVLAWELWPRDYAPNLNAASGETIFGAFIKIGRDGHITVAVPQCEMGQGVTTVLPQIIADELGADWRTIAVEPAPINPLYANVAFVDADSAIATPRALVPDALADVPRWIRREHAVREAMMLTAGSSSVQMFEGPCREAAAQARALLMMAAAQRWDADWQDCETDAGFVIHGQRKLRFADLAPAAATLTPPAEPIFRSSARDPLYGQELTRLDLPAKVDGSANFAGDVRLPGMVFASIRQGPHGDTTLVKVNKAAAAKIPGMLRIVQNDRWVAAVARNSWAAQRALDALAPEFSTTGLRPDSKTIDAALTAAIAGGGGTRMHSAGDIADAFEGRRIIAADFAVAPALHAAIETRTATAQVDGGRLRVWVATQAPAACRAAIARATGYSESAITLFPMMAGGSFGAALESDVAAQAAVIATTINLPVQLAYSRAEEIIRDYPRPPARARMTATLDAAGGIDALHCQIAVPAARHEIFARLDGVPAHEAATLADTQDAAAVLGAIPPYAIPHLAVDHIPVATGLPAGRWRGNADSYTAFFTETFVDELAARAKTDPLSYRIAMLGSAPELARCLMTATSLGGWEGGATGSAQGIACHSLRGSHIALMATARMTEIGLRVEQLVAVVDAGRIVNPAVARQQIEGGLIFGLAAAVGATTGYRGGLATARKLGQLGLPKLAQSPVITVELVESDRPPGGLGEIGVPVVAPAIANALASATGRRIRRLPLSPRAVANKARPS